MLLREAVPEGPESSLQPELVQLDALDDHPRGAVGISGSEVYFVFLARGAGVLHVPDAEWPLLRGTACVSLDQPAIAGPVLRGWALSLDWERGTRVGDSAVPSPGARLLPAGVATRCEGFFEALEAELDRGEDRVQPEAVQALLALILLCYERSPHSDTDAISISSASRAHALADEILRVIDERFAARLSLADIAEALNRSSSSVARAARAATGRSVLELIAERRITEAQHLLTETGKPIAEIAEQVGYASPGHFHRAFRRSTSLTPRAWRAEASRALAERSLASIER